MISYPELPTFQTAGFMKWFVESFQCTRGFPKRSSISSSLLGRVSEDQMVPDERKF